MLRDDRFVYAIGVRLARIVLVATGGFEALVSATTSWSEPRLCTFSERASTKLLNLLKVATLDYCSLRHELGRNFKRSLNCRDLFVEFLDRLQQTPDKALVVDAVSAVVVRQVAGLVGVGHRRPQALGSGVAGCN